MHICQCLTLQERGALTRHLFFSLISHVIQTHFSERRASCCRETARVGCCFLHCAAQSHLGKDGLQNNSIHLAQFTPSQT